MTISYPLNSHRRYSHRRYSQCRSVLRTVNVFLEMNIAWIQNAAVKPCVGPLFSIASHPTSLHAEANYDETTNDSYGDHPVSFLHGRFRTTPR